MRGNTALGSWLNSAENSREIKFSYCGCLIKHFWRHKLLTFIDMRSRCRFHRWILWNAYVWFHCVRVQLQISSLVISHKSPSLLKNRILVCVFTHGTQSLPLRNLARIWMYLSSVFIGLLKSRMGHGLKIGKNHDEKNLKRKQHWKYGL